MSKLSPARQLLEDRALRNAARGLVQSDLAFIREGMSAKSVATRVVGRVRSGAQDIGKEAVVVADENRATIGSAAVLGALGLAAWTFRAPILSFGASLLQRMGLRENSAEPEAAPARSDSE